MIAISQRNIQVGDIEGNTERFLADIETAKSAGAWLVVGTELMISGYMAGDAYEDDAWVRYAEEQNARIIESTRDSALAVIWGNIKSDPTTRNEDGRMRKYNAAYIAQNGVLVATPWGDHVPKTLMPNYGKFDDKRHFTSAKDRAYIDEYGLRDIRAKYMPVEMMIGDTRRRVAVLICEDMWDDDYAIKPVQLLRKNGADMIVNISASPFGIGKHGKRDRLLTRQSQWIDLIYD